MAERYDCIITGAGPAGLAAALYASRDRFKTLVLEKLLPGGQISTTDKIENYPGIERIDGPGLIEQMQKQAVNFGAEIKTGCEATKLKKLENGNITVYCDEEQYVARAVILAPGSDYRKLGVPGEEEFRSAGAGVSYCGTCDAPFFREKEVVVVGGGDAALTEALFIARFATRITLVHRRDEFRGEKIHQTAVEENPKITVAWDTVVDRINGKEKVESVTLRNVKTDETRELKCDGVFIFIGHQPNTAFLCNLFGEECTGEIETGYDMQTSIPGLFAIGDVRKNSYRQIATAVGEGATAAIAAEHYIAEHARGRKN